MNLRKACKGVAPGPSGLTADTVRILIDDDTATTNPHPSCPPPSPSQYMPAEVARAIGLGRMVALTKPNGRVRGIVVVLRRLVSQCLAQNYAQPIHKACQPHRFALATRSGTEAVVHALTAVTEANPTHTILSIDGVGAYDNICRNSMLQGLRDVPEANRCLPFVKMFYGAPSHYIWHSATGEAHIISQTQGGEQGDPLLSALLSLGQRSHITTTSPRQRVFACFSRRRRRSGATQQSPPSLRHPGPHVPKPSQHPPQPRKNPRMERSWH